MLTTNQLLRITSNHSCTQDTLDGVYSIDLIPNQANKYPAFYIINNKPADHPGEHWISCFFPSRFQTAELFCSLGKSPEEYSNKLIGILRQNGNGDFKYNTTQLQSDISKACGYFALYYCDLRSKGLSYDYIMRSLSNTDYEKNEQIVQGYVNNHMLE